MTVRGFAYAGCPEGYPGDTFWWTLRFAGEPPAQPPAVAQLARLGLSWPEPGRSEWVVASTLAIGDDALGGRIVALTQVGGAAAFKVDLGRNASRIVPLRSLDGRVERRVPRPPSRNVQLEGQHAISDARLLRYLDLVHSACPLVAVVFQEGQFLGGAGLIDLDDVALLRAIRERDGEAR